MVEYRVIWLRALGSNRSLFFKLLKPAKCKAQCETQKTRHEDNLPQKLEDRATHKWQQQRCPYM